MLNPWIEWQKMVRAGTMLSETLTATQAVVEHRSRTIEQAMTDPLQADLGELGRMVSEKRLRSTRPVVRCRATRRPCSATGAPRSRISRR